jgi:hypothetical protein
MINMNLIKIIKNLKKQVKKYNIKGSVLLLALFVLLFSFTIIIILYLINKRYVIYAKGERENYLKAVYPQKKKDILDYLIRKAVKEFYYTSLIYNQEGLYEVYKNSETFYTPLTAPLENIYMLYKLYSTDNLSTLRYYIDINTQPSDSNTIIYPYMNTYIKSAIIQSTNARIIKL